MKSLKATIGFTAALLSASVAVAQTYRTSFSVGTTLAPTYTNGGFFATLSGPSLGYYSSLSDPCIINYEAGAMSLSFNQAVSEIAFDVSLDGYWHDALNFSVAPGSLQPAINTDFLFHNGTPALSGALLYATGTVNGQGARVVFSNLGAGAGVTSFNWNDVGTAGANDWVPYDNFSFTVVPEPSALALLVAGAALLTFRKIHWLDRFCVVLPNRIRSSLVPRRRDQNSVRPRLGRQVRGRPQVERQIAPLGH